jgi:hypothetical protein
MLYLTSADAAIAIRGRQDRTACSGVRLTAIREAAGDGNLATVADSNSRPLIATPAHREHLSGRVCASGWSAKTLTRRIGLFLVVVRREVARCE